MSKVEGKAIKGIARNKLVIGALTSLLMLLALSIGVKHARADYTAPSVIINEIMYNPTGIQANEFLELYNTTGSDVDLNGWCFTAGIGGCFTTGQTIAAHGFVVVSPNSSQTLTTYGVTALMVYTGALDNGGERITLQDSSHVTINSVLYDDVAPWPTSPDGNGPSLELKDPAIDNTLAASWSASSPAPTPGVTNSAYSNAHAVITDVSTASDVTPSQEVHVAAHVTNTTGVSLIYQINYDGDQTITMYDDGEHDDNASGDNTYGATIPAQAAGKLVRYKVSAVNGLNTDTKPGVDDSIHYYGYTVQDSGVDQGLKVLQWFISPADYDTLVANPEAATQYDCVVVYGNQVFDSSKVDVYGGSTRNYSKVSLEFELPTGYKLTIPGEIDRAIKEFQLEADIQNISGVQQELAWTIADDMGIATLQHLPIRLQRNGEFHGVFTLIEKFNQDWRKAHNMNDGAFYRDGEKRTRLNEDTSDFTAWSSAMNQPKSAERREYLLDNNDIPSLINFLAFEAVVRNHDWAEATNTISYRDTDGTGRWQFLPRDLDLTFQVSTLRPLISPLDSPTNVYIPARKFAATLYEEPDLRAMYFRRIRTMVDAYYSDNQLLSRFESIFNSADVDLDLEYPAWHTGGATKEGDKSWRVGQMRQMKIEYYTRYIKPWALPAAQTNTPDVDISAVSTGGGGSDEYITLTNNSSESVDLSGWEIDEINYTIPSGAVLLAGHSTVIVKDDVTYRSHHPGSYLIGQYSTSVNSNLSGSLTLKRADNSTASTFPY